MTLNPIDDWVAAVNKKYGTNLVFGSGASALNIRRFSTGILPLDLALGGGFARSRISLIVGDESTGKSTICLRTIAESQKYAHKYRCTEDQLPAGAKFNPAQTLYIDVEGTFDEVWARKNGVVLSNIHTVRPESAEQSIDIAASAIDEDLFDIIIVDSIAALTPMKELESSTEDQQMGLAARLVNKAMRIWPAKLCKLSQKPHGGPVVICINQFREKIGVMFGDPRTYPGGKMQKFSASTIIYTNSPAYSDKKGAEGATVTLKGVIKKNKTYRPRVNYSFDLGLVDTADLKEGEVNNNERIMYYLKKFGLLKKEGSSYKIGMFSFAKQEDIAARLNVSQVFRDTCWHSIIVHAVGSGYYESED